MECFIICLIFIILVISIIVLNFSISKKPNKRMVTQYGGGSRYGSGSRRGSGSRSGHGSRSRHGYRSGSGHGYRSGRHGSGYIYPYKYPRNVYNYNYDRNYWNPIDYNWNWGWNSPIIPYIYPNYPAYTKTDACTTYADYLCGGDIVCNNNAFSRCVQSI